MLIRPAERLDGPELVGMLGDVVPHEVDEAKAAYIIDLLTQDPVTPALCFVVAEVRGELAGAAMMERVQDLWSDQYIVVKRLFYVAPQHRGSKVGAFLLAKVVEWIDDIPSLARIELSVETAEELDTSFRKRGYAPVSVVYG